MHFYQFPLPMHLVPGGGQASTYDVVCCLVRSMQANNLFLSIDEIFLRFFPDFLYLIPRSFNSIQFCYNSLYFCLNRPLSH